MADFNLPTITSIYTAIIDGFRERDEDVARGLRPDMTSPVNLPTGAIRYNPTTRRWEELNASAAWQELTASFAINVEKLGNQTGTYYLDWNHFENVPTEFPPEAHNHNDLYYTEVEADGRFLASLTTSGNQVQLRSADNAILGTLTVPYATSAGQATNLAGYVIDQNLRGTDNVTFAQVTTNGNIVANGKAFIKGAAGQNSLIHFWDNTADVWRDLYWSVGQNEWMVEDASGVSRRLFHEGHAPAWGEVTGKPTTYTPAPHGHAFSLANVLQFATQTKAQNDALTRAAAEPIWVTDEGSGRLYIHDGSTAGGHRVALSSDIPAQVDLSNYARIDQGVAFTSFITAGGAITTPAWFNGQGIKVTDTSSAAAKNLAVFKGASHQLEIVDLLNGDYALRNSLNGNAINFYDGSGGVAILYGGSARFVVNQTSTQVQNTELLIKGNTAWHSGNDGAGSGLDADRVDGIEGADLYRIDQDSLLVNRGTTRQLRVDYSSVINAIEFRPVLADGSAISAVDDFGFDLTNRYWYFDKAPRVNGQELFHPGNAGSGSGLDADKLDGVHAAGFLRADQDSTLQGKLTVNAGEIVYPVTTGLGSLNGPIRIFQNSARLYFQEDASPNRGIYFDLPAISSGAHKAWHEGNMGPGSGLDADTVRNFTPDQFLRSDAADTGTDLTLNNLIIKSTLQWENGVNRITHNDGGGNVQFRFGHQFANSKEVFTHIGGAVDIESNIDAVSDTNITFRVSSNPTAGIDEQVLWGQAFRIGTTDVTFGGNQLWHEGNDGPSSGLNADLLDGVHANAFALLAGADFTGPVSVTGGLDVDQLTVSGLTATHLINTATAYPLVLESDATLTALSLRSLNHSAEIRTDGAGAVSIHTGGNATGVGVTEALRIAETHVVSTQDDIVAGKDFITNSGRFYGNSPTLSHHLLTDIQNVLSLTSSQATAAMSLRSTTGSGGLFTQDGKLQLTSGGNASGSGLTVGLTLDAAGKVGLGTTTPLSPLSVVGTKALFGSVDAAAEDWIHIKTGVNNEGLLLEGNNSRILGRTTSRAMSMGFEGTDIVWKITTGVASNTNSAPEAMRLSGADLHVQGNIHGRGALLDDVVTDVRFGSQQTKVVGNDSGSDAYYTLPGNAVVQSIGVRWSWTDDVVDGIKGRPIQKKVNGSWVTVV